MRKTPVQYRIWFGRYIENKPDITGTEQTEQLADRVAIMLARHISKYKCNRLVWIEWFDLTTSEVFDAGQYDFS